MDGRGVIVERRRAVRRSPGTGDPLSRARLRTGPELVVTEISDLGARVRTSARLLPGTHVDVHLMTVGGRVLRRARVARATVWSLDPTGIAFQVALAFDTPVDSSVRRVGATHGNDPAVRRGGDDLPGLSAIRSEVAVGSAPIEPVTFAALAPHLEQEAGRTAAKESRDVDH